jgi:dTMP kinase
MPKPSLFIIFEGIDGCGKSTLARNVAAALEASDHKILLTKEPGGSKLGVAVRQILHEQPEPLEAVSEFLLFAADRAEHFRKIIIPALQAGTTVISDRCADSSVAYQGYARGVDVSFITYVNAIAMAGVVPTVTFFVDLAPAFAFNRLSERGNKLTSIETRGIAFFERARAGFQTIYKNRKNVVTLDGTQTPEQLTQAALAALAPWL